MKRVMNLFLMYAALAVVLILADYGVKYLVRTNMQVGDTIPVIKDVFHITYVQNTGAAFSILSGKQYFLITLTTILILGIIVYIIIKKPKQHIIMLPLTLIIAGGTGNLIDRIMLKYVVDFFDFRLINFAVFNTADMFVVIGAVLIATYLILEDKNKIKNGG